jgi:biotin carboxyl carrier protein
MKIEAAVRGARQGLDVDALEDGTLIVHVDGTEQRLRLDRACGSECWRLVVDGTAMPVRIRRTDAGADVILGASRVAVAVRRALPIPSRRAGAAGGADRVDVRAPMPGLVIAVPRAAGDVVDAGTSVAVVEAMKMQMDVSAPAAGRIEEVRVRPGQEVMGGQVLASIRPEGAWTP